MTDSGSRQGAGAQQTGLLKLEEVAARALAGPSQPSRPPVHLWNPPDCGQIPMQIKRDGTWWHDGSPIKRSRLVALFASILRRDGDLYYLVTPVEKWQIEVEDAPFLAVELCVEGIGQKQILEFRTQFDDFVVADSDHPIRVTTNPQTGEPSPYVMIRDGLEARLTRAVFYELVALGAEEDRGGRRLLGVWSMDCFFALGLLDEVWGDE